MTQTPEQDMITALRLLFAEQDVDPPVNITAELAAEFFGFSPSDVKAVYRHKEGAGSGLWFALKDGRVFDWKGNPCARDPALYAHEGEDNP